MDISVVMPTYSNTEMLSACLDAFCSQTYPKDQFEVIVVDDGSYRPIKPIVELFHGKINCFCVQQDNTGPATARNNGTVNASGDFFAFIDDDCRPHPDWLAAIAARLKLKPDSMIGGKTVNSLDTNIFSSASQELIDFLYRYFQETDSPYRFFTSNNLAMPANRFHQVGGFDENMPLAAGEDRELCERWQHYGLPMVYLPEAVVFHAHALCLGSFVRQHFNYGRGASRYQAIRRQKWGKQIAFAPFSFYLKLIVHPWTARKSNAFLLFGLLILSQIANAAGFVTENFHNRVPATRRAGQP